MRLVVLTLVSVLVSSCGIAGGNYACDLRPGDPQCTDWRDIIGPSVTQEGVCRTLISAKGSGEWKPNTRCPATGSVGGCQTNSGVGFQTNWFYAPKTEQEVRTECMNDNTTFVPPTP